MHTHTHPTHRTTGPCINLFTFLIILGYNIHIINLNLIFLINTFISEREKMKKKNLCQETKTLETTEKSGHKFCENHYWLKCIEFRCKINRSLFFLFFLFEFWYYHIVWYSLISHHFFFSFSYLVASIVNINFIWLLSVWVCERVCAFFSFSLWAQIIDSVVFFSLHFWFWYFVNESI